MTSPIAQKQRSRFARRITQSGEKNFGMFGKAYGKPGDLIHLELGKPLEDTPDHIKEAAIQALRDGKVHYSDLKGIPELRDAIAAKLHADNSLDFDADEIIVTNGLTQASFAAFMALLDEGDEAILLEPFYPQHIGKIELAGARAVMAPLDASDGFSIRRDLIEPKITDRTRMIVLINPCNPTGRVYSREELQVVADLAIEHDLIVVSDEVYEHIVFDGARHISIASLPGMRERTITMFAFTKAYAMDGWRLGWIAADASFIGPLMKITTNEVTHVNTFIQYGAVAALTGPVGELHRMVEGDRRRRDLVVQRLNQMPGVTCDLPQGTIYAFADISGTGLKSQDLATQLMEREGVVVEAGGFYGEAGDRHIRVCFGAESEARLTEAMNRMQRFFNARH